MYVGRMRPSAFLCLYTLCNSNRVVPARALPVTGGDAAMRGHPGVEYVALGIFLTVDGMLWRDALRVPPRRRGQVAAAIVGLVLVDGTLLDLLVPF
jgi:hypothetical protein